jgi:hypothetical protein
VAGVAHLESIASLLTNCTKVYNPKEFFLSNWEYIVRSPNWATGKFIFLF